MDNRDFYRIFRGFLGLNRTGPGFPPDEDRERGDKYSDQEHRNDPNFRNFQVFTDPLGKHRSLKYLKKGGLLNFLIGKSKIGGKKSEPTIINKFLEIYIHSTVKTIAH